MGGHPRRRTQMEKMEGWDGRRSMNKKTELGWGGGWPMNASPPGSQEETSGGGKRGDSDRYSQKCQGRHWGGRWDRDCRRVGGVWGVINDNIICKYPPERVYDWGGGGTEAVKVGVRTTPPNG